MINAITSQEDFIKGFIEIDNKYYYCLKESYTIEPSTEDEVKEALLEKQDWLKTELIKIQHYLRQFKPSKNELDPDIGYYSCLIKELLAFLKTHRKDV